MAVALPDICAKIDEPDERDKGARYSRWCESYLRPQDAGLTGFDYWVLRCAFLHHGDAEIQDQHAYKKANIGRIYLTESAAVSVAGVKKIRVHPPQDGQETVGSDYALPIGAFCDRIVVGVQAWMQTIQDDPAKQADLNRLLTIHPKTFSHQ